MVDLQVEDLILKVHGKMMILGCLIPTNLLNHLYGVVIALQGQLIFKYPKIVSGDEFFMIFTYVSLRNSIFLKGLKTSTNHKIMAEYTREEFSDFANKIIAIEKMI